MKSISTKSDSSQPAADTAVYLFDDWFDPIEAGVRDRVREFIQAMIKRLVQTKAMKQMLVSTSPRGGDDQPPQKNPNGKPKESGKALNHQDRQGG
jgi:hypothetical protein